MNRGRHKKGKEKEFNTQAEILVLYEKNFVYCQQYMKVNHHIM